MGKYVIALDQGTTSSRCILFDEQGSICSVAQKEFTQIYPQPGWVEHNPMEIWSSQLSVTMEAMGKIGAHYSDIAAIGITNQRETTALGAAYLAGLATGVWRDTHELTRLWKPDITFTPNMSPMERDHLTAQWHKAVGRSLHWAK